VARDRQRAKQRRRRQPGAGGSGRPGRPRPREADIESEPADLVEPEATDVPEPEPASTVFPQRGDVQPVESEEPFDGDEAVAAAPDELDPAVAEEERERRRPVRPGRPRFIIFLGHVVDELRRVQWPDRRHVGQGTAVVLGFVVIAGSYLGLLDAIWKPLIEAIL
jgi:preprotein translocase SecE subunit